MTKPKRYPRRSGRPRGLQGWYNWDEFDALRTNLSKLGYFERAAWITWQVERYGGKRGAIELATIDLFMRLPDETDYLTFSKTMNTARRKLRLREKEAQELLASAKKRLRRSPNLG